MVVDGHDVEAICRSFYDAEQTSDRPTMILAKTYKGKGIPGIEDQLNWHGKAIGAKADEAIKAIEAEMVDKDITGEKLNTQVVKDDVKPADPSAIPLSEMPTYPEGAKVATRNAYGTALAKLGRSSKRVVALDGDTKNSTFAITFQKEFPGLFFFVSLWLVCVCTMYFLSLIHI